MKRIITILSLLFSAKLVISQDSLWQKMKLDENISISFPKNVKQIDTFFLYENKETKVKTLHAKTEFSILALTATLSKGNLEINNKESLQKELLAISEGSLHSFKENGLLCVVDDTLINNIPCKKLKCIGRFSADTPNVLSYYFLVNDTMYNIAGSFSPKFAAGALVEMDRLLKSIHIDAVSVKELKLE